MEGRTQQQDGVVTPADRKRKLPTVAGGPTADATHVAADAAGAPTGLETRSTQQQQQQQQQHVASRQGAFVAAAAAMQPFLRLQTTSTQQQGAKQQQQSSDRSGDTAANVLKLLEAPGRLFDAVGVGCMRPRLAVATVASHVVPALHMEPDQERALLMCWCMLPWPALQRHYTLLHKVYRVGRRVGIAE
jgi:hypothetical protein